MRGRWEVEGRNVYSRGIRMLTFDAERWTCIFLDAWHGMAWCCGLGLFYGVGVYRSWFFNIDWYE